MPSEIKTAIECLTTTTKNYAQQGGFSPEIYQTYKKVNANTPQIIL